MFVVGPVDRPDYEKHGYPQDTKVKPGAATAVVELLMMGGRTPETFWAVNKRQDNKLENCCIWLVIYLNCTMKHGLTNVKKNGMVPTLKMTNWQRKTEAKFFTRKSNIQPSDPQPVTPLAELYRLIANGFLCLKDSYWYRAFKTYSVVIVLNVFPDPAVCHIIKSSQAWGKTCSL